MIATVILHDETPLLQIPLRALEESDLHPGQRVRVDVSPLGPTTPRMESDGFY